MVAYCTSIVFTFSDCFSFLILLILGGLLVACDFIIVFKGVPFFKY